MAVPANPKLTQVIAEFLAPASARLSQFLRGGLYVPDAPPNVGVPTALPIRLSQLAGAIRQVSHTAVNDPASNTQLILRPGTISASLTCIPSMGVGPFTYAWTHDLPQLNISSPTAKTTTISRFVSKGTPVNDPNTGPTVTMSGTVYCTSTDTNDGHQYVSATAIDWTWEGDGG